MVASVALPCIADTVPEGMPLLLTQQSDSHGLPDELLAPPTPKRRLALKSNLLPWIATIPNFGIETDVSNRVSLSLPVWWCPWFIGKSHSLRVLAFQPEARWWFDRPGNGHFIGPHFSLAWYNFKNGETRYQDKGQPLLGGGLTYGYSLPLKGEWRMEFSVGVGYCSLKYDRFYNVDNGARIDTRKTSYFGVDHAGVSVSYNFKL